VDSGRVTGAVAIGQVTMAIAVTVVPFMGVSPGHSRERGNAVSVGRAVPASFLIRRPRAALQLQSWIPARLGMTEDATPYPGFEEPIRWSGSLYSKQSAYVQAVEDETSGTRNH
jgi:hypothetical protein